MHSLILPAFLVYSAPSSPSSFISPLPSIPSPPFLSHSPVSLLLHAPAFPFLLIFESMLHYYFLKVLMRLKTKESTEVSFPESMKGRADLDYGFPAGQAEPAWTIVRGGRRWGKSEAKLWNVRNPHCFCEPNRFLTTQFFK